MHKWKQGIGRLKIARLPRHVLLRFLAVICVLRVITIIEFGKIKSKDMRTNNNNLVDFSKEYTYVASESLVQEAKEKHSNIYLNFSYTNYGGSFLNKVIISYFKEYYPENIVHERTAWYGENAFVFGKPAKELFQQIENGNILDFDNLTDYYYAKFYEQVTEEATNFISDYELNNNLHEIICKWLCTNGSPKPNFVDYSDNDLNKYLYKNGYL